MIDNPVIDDERLLRLSEVENMTDFKKHLSMSKAKKAISPNASESDNLLDGRVQKL